MTVLLAFLKRKEKLGPRLSLSLGNDQLYRHNLTPLFGNNNFGSLFFFIIIITLKAFYRDFTCLLLQPPMMIRRLETGEFSPQNSFLSSGYTSIVFLDASRSKILSVEIDGVLLLLFFAHFVSSKVATDAHFLLNEITGLTFLYRIRIAPTTPWYILQTGPVECTFYFHMRKEK